MIVDAIKDVSRRAGIVLDLFGGSGSSLSRRTRPAGAREFVNSIPSIVIASSIAGRLSPRTMLNLSLVASGANGQPGTARAGP